MEKVASYTDGVANEQEQPIARCWPEKAWSTGSRWLPIQQEWFASLAELGEIAPVERFDFRD